VLKVVEKILEKKVGKNVFFLAGYVSAASREFGEKMTSPGRSYFCNTGYFDALGNPIKK
jgi:hypothetical protein